MEFSLQRKAYNDMLATHWELQSQSAHPGAAEVARALGGKS